MLPNCNLKIDKRANFLCVCIYVCVCVYIYIYINHNLKIIYIIYNIYVNHNLKTLKLMTFFFFFLMTFFENKTSHRTGPAFSITKEIEVYWNEISR